MSEYERDEATEREDDYALDKANLDETEEAKEDDLRREQEGHGYGEDEGEREQALNAE
ncbi:MAG: hypothetical protein M3321_05105 [Actinomycetota bacterium]|nr:hypothetical protein [Actinomycetota bacterium]